jgi:hypothetical protein
MSCPSHPRWLDQSNYTWRRVLLNETLQPLVTSSPCGPNILSIHPVLKRGTRWRSWLRHYATSRKVAGSISNEVMGFFTWPNPPTEMSTRNLPGGKGRPARKTDNLTAICEPIVWKMWEPRLLTTLWACTACYRDGFIFFLLSSQTPSVYALPLISDT